MAGKQATEAQYMETIGRLVDHSASADFILMATFQALAQCDPKVAVAVIYTLDAMPTKRNMIRRAMRAAPHDDEDVNILESILAAADCVQKQRNELSHAMRGTPDNSTDAFRFNFRDMTQPRKPATVDYLSALLNTSGTSLMQAMASYQQLCQKRGVRQLAGIGSGPNDSQGEDHHQTPHYGPEVPARPLKEPED